MGTVTERQVAHIWKRLGFGATGKDIDNGVAVGPAALINDLLTRPLTTPSQWNLPTASDWQSEIKYLGRQLQLMGSSSNPLQERVFVLLTTEFGRQQTANASAGCDHGQAGVSVLLGGGVKGGIYGQAPLTDPAHRLDDALIPTVDFRSVYNTVLNRLAQDTSTSTAVLGQPFADLGVFTASGASPSSTTPQSSTTSTTLTTSTTSTTVRR